MERIYAGKSKSIDLWFKKLPKHIQEKAFANRKRYLSGGRNHGAATRKQISLSDAIFYGFCWAETPEEFDYWKIIKENTAELHYRTSKTIDDIEEKWDGVDYNN